ncbi:MAG: CPBP family intramembrane metalloprotease [Candidatus Thermoplasmatota archaeon]|nr:CPBP family intramembrane metalloprotease [Candidatus Thermoplasmatota archaeon]
MAEYLFIMDLDLRKPTHLFAVFLIFLSLFMFVLVPIASFFGLFGTIDSSPALLTQIPEGLKIIFEILTLLIQLTLVIFLFVIVPFAWYKLVNNYSLSEIFEAIRLKREKLDIAFVYGFVTAAITLGIVMIFGFLVTILGFDLSDASNIKDIEKIFSTPVTLVLITLQPITEEIFYRGFLLEKIEKLSSPTVAVVITAVLFGLAHLSIGNVYPAFLTAVAGIILAILVIKTKNLTAAIIAHILFNVSSFTLYTLGQSLI